MWIVARFSPFEWHPGEATKYHRVSRRLRDLYGDTCTCNDQMEQQALTAIDDPDLDHCSCEHEYDGGLCCEVEEILQQQQIFSTRHQATQFKQFRYSICTACSDENCGRGYFNCDAYRSSLYVRHFEVEVSTTTANVSATVADVVDATSSDPLMNDDMDINHPFLARCQELPAIDSQTFNSAEATPIVVSPSTNINDVDFDREPYEFNHYLPLPPEPLPPPPPLPIPSPSLSLSLPPPSPSPARSLTPTQTPSTALSPSTLAYTTNHRQLDQVEQLEEPLMLHNNLKLDTDEDELRSICRYRRSVSGTEATTVDTVRQAAATSSRGGISDNCGVVVDNQSINYDLTTDDFANEDEIELTLFHNDFTLINSFWYTIGTLMASTDLNPKVFMHVYYFFSEAWQILFYFCSIQS